MHYKHILNRLMIGGLAFLPWSCTDHQPQPTPTQLLTGCTRGWVTANQTYQGSFIGGLAPGCYHIIFNQDGTLVVDRTQCKEDTTPLSLGTWSSTETSLALPVRPWNIYGLVGPNHIESLTASTLQFSYRGGPDKITETWSCP